MPMNINHHNLIVVSVAFAICIGTLASNSFAQYPGGFRQYKELDRYRYLPRLPQGNENPPPLPLEERDVTGDPKVLVDELKGLVFVDDPNKIIGGKLDTAGVHVNSDYGLGIVKSRAFHRLAESYLGGPISIRRLNELVRDIIRFYRRNDQPVVDVSIPEQDITDGVVQIVVTEARVGEVRVEKPCYFNPCVLVNQVCISPGDRIYESVLQSDLRWLYRNPFRRVELELEPGENRGETDVIFNVYDRAPIRGYFGYEDTGNRATYLERLFVGFNWHNAFWRDDQMGYQYTTDQDFNRLEAHSGYYSTALLNRDIITIYGSYANFKAPQGPINTDGRTWQILARWYREFCPIGCYEHGVTAGFDYKYSTTNLEFFAVPVQQTPYNVGQFMAGYHGKRFDRLGAWIGGVDFYYSPGMLGGFNNLRAFQAVRPGATPHYFYSRMHLERRTWLTSNFEFVARATGQIAEGNLVPSEQLGLGGYNSVRGYDQYASIGDSGYFANLELWTAPMYIGLGQDELRFLAFYDFGDTYPHRPLVGQDPSVDMQGVGAGFRYNLQQRVELRVDYGWQLSQLALQPAPRERWHIGVVFSR